MLTRRALLASCACLLAWGAPGWSQGEPWTVEEVLDVAPVWSGHPVGFALLTHDGRQFAAYYDAERRMTVASRDLGAPEWTYTVLPETVGWDSHNYITMAADRDGCIHLSGNMHCVPLVYFRTREPLDATSFERVLAMTGERETRVTYPSFLRTPEGRLVFTYRDGSSGDGDQLFNVYDPDARTWSRLLDQPLFSGGGLMNAYFTGPTLGPDAFYHIAWMWRDTPACETNHDLSYARSRDLVNWGTSQGAPLALPITPETGEVVDPVPAGGGMINSNQRIGFDARGRPVLSYHKFDPNGNTQIYNARLEAGGWRIHQASDWAYRWDFEGGGSVQALVHVGGVGVDGMGRLTQSWSHVEYGSGVWELDEETLRPVGLVRPLPTRPAELGRPELSVEGISVRWAGDLGRGPDPDVVYMLRWETLGPNRDRPRETAPPPSTLRLYGFRTRAGG